MARAYHHHSKKSSDARGAELQIEDIIVSDKVVDDTAIIIIFSAGTCDMAPISNAPCRISRKGNCESTQASPAPPRP